MSRGDLGIARHHLSRCAREFRDATRMHAVRKLGIGPEIVAAEEALAKLVRAVVKAIEQEPEDER